MDWSQGESTGTSPETGTCPTQRDKYTCTICHCIKHLIFKKKKKLQRILIWKLNFRIKSEIIIMIIYTYRYMIFRYSNLKIDMNKYWYLAALKKSTYIVSVHIKVHTCISRIPYLVHLVVDTLCLVEHGMAGPSTQGQGSLGVECPPQLL